MLVILEPHEASKHFSVTKNIIEEAWGNDYLKHYENELKSLREPDRLIISTPTYDYILDNKLTVQGVALLTKSLMDFDFWIITWVTVGSEFRRNGIGKTLIKTCEEQAQSLHKNFPSQRIVIELTSDKPEFYHNLGYETVSKLFNGRDLMIKHL